MEKIDELTYYECLDIPVTASAFEIRKAYKEALGIYHEDSLASYSLFSDEERSRILQKIEEAFLILMDEKRRAEYNQMLGEKGLMDVSLLQQKRENNAVPIFDSNKARDKDIFQKKIRRKLEGKDLKKLSNDIHSKDIISGDDLKKLREAAGIELEEIFEVTRINIPILKSIENNQFERLPPTIYLKNFLMSFARLLDLDPGKIAKGYLENMTYHQKTIP
jgi:DnaJ-class molecular chaperone